MLLKTPLPMKILTQRQIREVGEKAGHFMQATLI